MWWIVVLVASQAVTLDDLVERVEEANSLSAKRLAQVPAIARGDLEKVLAGEVVTSLESVEGHKAKKAFGLVLADAPIGRMWSAINDNAGKAEVTKLAYAEVIKGEDCGDTRTVFQYLPVSLATDRWWVVEQQENKPIWTATDGRVREMFWSSLDDPDLPTEPTKRWAADGMAVEFTEGAWLLVKVEDKTLVQYYSWSDPGGMVPAGLASSFAAGSIKDTFATITAYAKKSPGCPIE